MKFFTLFFFVLVFTFVSLYEITIPVLPKTKMKKAMIGFDNNTVIAEITIIEITE